MTKERKKGGQTKKGQVMLVSKVRENSGEERGIGSILNFEK